ncbi:MAG: tRNA (adenosine(37)-N6)-dimethylallyltransferase MiaA [Lactobacillus sp.]|nr:tRNA (adenosine(37)-N6)-dimethylallyltransferase MiaA [Lactobacillus sp.]
MKKLLGIVGPTAMGKTKIAIDLANKLPGEIISGDSMQVYREVSIGTAKATDAEQAAAKHYLVGTHSIFEPYSVKNFVDEASAAIEKVQTMPILAGGTGLYVNCLINDMQLGEENEIKSPVDDEWQDFLDKNGSQALWNKLYELDPKACEKIPVQNTRRALRALTVISRTGKKFSEQQSEIKPRYDYLLLGLKTDRELMYERINHRVDLMVEAGLVDEAKYVFEHRSEIFQLGQAIGYKELFPYFEGKSDLDTCLDKLKQASRHFAKRQLTYFQNKLPVVWLDPILDDQFFEKMLETIYNWQKD